MEVAEFLEWEPEDGLRYELVDGEPRAMAPTLNAHGYLQQELGRLIGNHLRARGSRCDVVSNPGVVPRLLSARNVRISELGVIRAGWKAAERALDEPVLLVEVLSPSNRADTWSNVWAYTSIPSVREILVLESTRVAAELLRRDSDGAWPEQPERVGAGELLLASIDFRVSMTELYARTGLTG